MAYSMSLKRLLSELKNSKDIFETFSYLEKERLKLFKFTILNQFETNLDLIQLVTLFASLSFLSKVFYILNKDLSDYKNTMDDFKRFEEVLNRADINKNLYSEFIKKPRDFEINETEAFIYLINNSHISFGLQKNNNALNSIIWRKYRNYLLHSINLKSDTKIINNSITKDKTLKNSKNVNLNVKKVEEKSLPDYSFYVATKDELNNINTIISLIKNNYHLENFPINLYFFTINIDNLNNQIYLLYNEIVENFKKGKYKSESVEKLYQWFNFIQSDLNSLKINMDKYLQSIKSRLLNKN